MPVLKIFKLNVQPKIAFILEKRNKFVKLSAIDTSASDSCFYAAHACHTCMEQAVQTCKCLGLEMPKIVLSIFSFSKAALCKKKWS